MRRLLTIVPALLATLAVASFAGAQTPTPLPAAGNSQGAEQVVRGGGMNPITGRMTQFETKHNPLTGKLERKSITGTRLSSRVTERVESYDPQSGTWTYQSIDRDTWTGRAIEARRTENIVTGVRTQQIGTNDALIGQQQGVYRVTQQDPQSGIIRRDVGQYNFWRGAPTVGGFGNSTMYYNPYTGQMVNGIPSQGWQPR